MKKKSKKQDKSKSKKSKKQNGGNFVSIGEYQLAKNGKTKFIKLSPNPKSAESKKVVKALIKALGGVDVLFVNLFDDDFKEKHNIPDFAKGRISVNLDAKPRDEDEEDDEDEDEEEDESDDEDDDSDDDEDEDEDEDEEDDEDDDDDSDF